MHKTYIVKAPHVIPGPRKTTSTIWLPVGRVTILSDDGERASKGLLRLNHVPGVTYHLFEPYPTEDETDAP